MPEGLLTNGHADDEPVWDGIADGTGQSWADWWASRESGEPVAGDGLSATDAADGSRASDAGSWADWQADAGRDDGLTPIPLSAVPAGPAPRVACDIIHPDPGSLTVIFGDGGAGKGTLAAMIATRWTAEGRGRVLLLDAEGHPREWRRRIAGLGGDLGNVYHVEHPGGAIVPQDYAAAGYGLCIVDSAAYFTPKGADAWTADAATSMQLAAKASGVPWLVLAHVSKLGDGTRAYGSTFWHNVPRASHSIERQDDGTRWVTCHKATDVEGLDVGKGWRFEVAYQADGVTPTSAQLVAGVREAVPSRLAGWVHEMGEVTIEEAAAFLNVSYSTAAQKLKAAGCVNTSTGRTKAVYVAGFNAS